jgi:hypothetical protein
MKKLLLIPVALMLVLTSCKKETTEPGTEMNTVSTQYKAFIVEFTATWCPYCGTYGYPAWESTLTGNQYKVTGLSIHPDDDIVNEAYPAQSEFETFYQCGGYPSAGFGVTGNGYPSESYYEGGINAALSANGTAKAGIGITKEISGSNMIITTKTVLFNDLSGTYNLAVYLVEDGIVNDQATTTSSIQDAVHDRVFRGSNGDLAWGTTIITGSGTKGTKIDGTYTIPIPSDVRSTANLHVVVVLYKYDTATSKPTAVINSNTI